MCAGDAVQQRSCRERLRPAGQLAVDVFDAERGRAGHGTVVLRRTTARTNVDTKNSVAAEFCTVNR